MNAHSSLHLDLPYILPAQAQKYITHNESLNVLDVLVQLQVQSDDLTQPPTTAKEGDLYIVGSSSSAIWAGKENQVAHHINGGWTFYRPAIGWRVWIEQIQELKVWRGDTWQAIFGASVSHERLGINAAADTQQRFAVSSPSSLFNHEGNGHRLTINKNNDTDHSSILFQTGFSGRHEIASDANDDFVFKVSSDGGDFSEALKIDGQSAETTIEKLKFPDFWRWYSSTTLIVRPTNGQKEVCILNTASHNPGSSYDGQTGEFTTPKTGLYLLGVNFNTEGDVPFNCDVEVNGIAVSRIQFFPNNFSHLSKMMCLPLEKNDVLTLVAINGGAVRFDAGGTRDNITLLRLGVF
ncbi:MAG: DUF2793 domain-containing protein [Litorimonas sp.]